MSCFLKKCQNFFCEKCQVLYFLFVHLRLTDGYIPVFNRKAKRWMLSPLGSRAHSTLPVLFSVFLISLPIFSGLFCGAYACRMRAINSPCRANRSYIGCTAARNLAFSSSSSSVTSMPAARRSLLRPEPALHLGALPGTQADDLRVALVQCGQFFHHSRACKLHLRHAGMLIL